MITEKGGIPMANFCPCTIGNSVSKALFNLRDARKLNNCEPEQTSPATVLSRTVRHNNSIYHEAPWQYVVTFRLESGEEKELVTTEEHYRILKEGCEGTLTWQEDALIAFEL
jgi:hypothetical protein